MKHTIESPMARILRPIAVFAMGLLFMGIFSSSAFAEEINGPLSESKPVFTGSHFAWGAEVGSSLDMTSHDLSTFDVDVMLGYKNSIIKIVGVGTGIHRSISAGNNFIPLYAMLRTGLTRRPSPFFLNLQAGYSFSRVGYAGTGGHAGNKGNSSTIGDYYGALGVGIMLKDKGPVRPYVVLSAACQHYNSRNLDEVELDSPYLLFARVVIGVNF